MRSLDKILNVCERRGITQADLADAIHSTESRLSQMKGNPRSELKPRQILRAARFLGLDVESLLDETVEEPEAGLTAMQRAILRTVEKHRFLPEDAIAALTLAARTRDEGGVVHEKVKVDKVMAIGSRAEVAPDPEAGRRRRPG